MRSSLGMLLAVTLVLGSCSGTDGTGTTEHSTGSTAAGTVPTSSGGTVPTADTSPQALGVEVGKVGFTYYLHYDRPAVTAAAELHNTSDSYVHLGLWQAELLDANGAVVADTTDLFDGSVAPGATVWLVPNFVLEEGTAEPSSIRVEVLEAQLVEVEQLANGTMPVGDAPVRQLSGLTYLDVNDEMHVEAVFRNDGGARLTQLYASCGLYANDEPVGGTYAFVSEILPGAAAGIDSVLGLGTITPLPTDVRCAANTVNTSTYEPGATGSGLEVKAGMTYNPAGGQGKFYDTLVGVTVHNPSAEAAFTVHIDVDVLDAAGNIVHVVTPSETYVLPGETLHTGIRGVMALDSAPPASVVARTRVESWGDPTNASLGSSEGLDLTAYRFGFAGLAAHLEVGLLRFVGTVTNASTADLEDAVISCAALQAGQPTGGASWTLGPTPAGIPTGFEIIAAFSAVPVYDTIDCNVHLTSITAITP